MRFGLSRILVLLPAECNKIRMGCLCAKPVPPPAAHSNLVGTWANNANAAALRTGYGRYRHKYGFIMGIDDAQTGDEELCVRLKIDAVGFVSYKRFT